MADCIERSFTGGGSDGKKDANTEIGNLSREMKAEVWRRVARGNLEPSGGRDSQLIYRISFIVKGWGNVDIKDSKTTQLARS